MQTNDVATLLGITISDDQQTAYQAKLDAAIDYAKNYCNNDFMVSTTVDNGDGTTTTTSTEIIPNGAQMGIAWLVKSMTEQPNVQSQSLGDMQKQFFQDATFIAAMNYLRPYRKAKFF